MWPRRSRRTLLSVTSTPHLSQITPRCFMRLYLPHKHSQSVTGPKILAQNRPSRSGLNVRTVVDGLRLGDFAVGPGTDFFRTRQADANGIEVRDQTGAIIWAAAIQGRFLLPSFRRGRVPAFFLAEERQDG